jgi:putative solute:sodium symporter small subunit
MTTPSIPQDDRRHESYWRANTRLIAVLTLLWAIVSFGPALAGIDSLFLFGAPLSLWMMAQGAPIAYVLLVWFYERRMDRLDRLHQAGPDG